MKKFFPHLYVVLVALIFTIIFTWPYVTVLDKFYYDRGDFPVSGSILAYNEYALRTGRIFDQEKYFNGYQFYPQPYTLAYSDLRLFPSFIYTPIFWLTNNFILSVNLTTFLTFFLSFLSSFYVVLYFVKNRFAAIVGALIFTFNPMTFSRFPEHFELLNKYFLPLIFLTAYRFIEKPTLKNSIYFAATFTLNGFAAVYYQLLSIILLPVFVLPILIQQLKTGSGKYLFRLIKYLLIILIFIPLIFYFYTPFNDFSKQEMTTRSIEDVAFYSARLIDFISSTKQSFLYGAITSSLDSFRAPKDPSGQFNYIEHTLFPTVLPLLLFGFGIWYLFKSKAKEQSMVFTSFALLFTIALLISLGPFFQGWNGKESQFQLPYNLLYNTVGFFKGMRAPTRVLFFASVSFSLFAAFGFYYISKRFPWPKILLTVVAFIIFIENFNFDGAIVSFNERSKVIEQTRQLVLKREIPVLENKKVIHLPPLAGYVGLASAYLNWGVFTREIMGNGNSGYLLRDQLLFLNELGKLDEKAYQKMISLNFDYLIIHKDMSDDAFSWNNIQKHNLPGMVYEDQNLVIVALNQIQKPKICDFDKDLSKEFKLYSVNDSLQTVEALEIINHSNCFYPAIYMDKYKTMEIKKRDFYGNSLTTLYQYKLPVVIEPFQKVILSRIFGNLSSGL